MGHIKGVVTYIPWTIQRFHLPFLDRHPAHHCVAVSFPFSVFSFPPASHHQAMISALFAIIIARIKLGQQREGKNNNNHKTRKHQR